MRPAHIHLRVAASGFRPVTTHVFVAGDPYLGSDAAFGVKADLIVAPVRVEDPAAPPRTTSSHRSRCSSFRCDW